MSNNKINASEVLHQDLDNYNITEIEDINNTIQNESNHEIEKPIHNFNTITCENLNNFEIFERGVRC